MANKKEEFLDKNIERDRAGRTLFGIFALIFVPLFFALIFALIFGSVFSAGGSLVGFILGLGVGIYLDGQVYRMVTVVVPYPQGLVAQNVFTGEPIVYGAGTHFRGPWEQVTREGNISLEDRTSVHGDLTIDTKSGTMTVKISFQWRPRLSHLDVYRRMGDDTINGGFFEPMERFVSTLMAEMTGEQARELQSLMSKLAKAAFEGKDAGDVDVSGERKPGGTEEATVHNALIDRALSHLRSFRDDVKDLEEDFGIKLIQVNVSDIDFTKDVQKTRAAKSEVRGILESAADLAGLESVEEFNALPAAERKEWLDQVRGISGNAPERILTIKGDRQGLMVDTRE